MVHPITKGMYDKAGFEYREKTEELVMMNFDRVTKDKPRRYRIDQMYRVRHIDKDYIVYNQTIFSTDFPGNEISASELVGFHDEPQFQRRYDDATGQPKPIAVAGNVLKYDIPATRENIKAILSGTVIEPTSSVYNKKAGEKLEMVDHNTNFVLQNGNAKYGGFTAEEFATKHFDDLLYKASTGFYPRQTKAFDQQEKVKGDDAVKEEQKAFEKEQKELEKQQKEQDKELEKQQKEAEKERERQNKEQEKEHERLDREAEKERERLAKQQEKEQKEQQDQEQQGPDIDTDQQDGQEQEQQFQDSEVEPEDEQARTAASNATDQDLQFRHGAGQSKAGRGQRKTAGKR